MDCPDSQLLANQPTTSSSPGRPRPTTHPPANTHQPHTPSQPPLPHAPSGSAAGCRSCPPACSAPRRCPWSSCATLQTPPHRCSAQSAVVGVWGVVRFWWWVVRAGGGCGGGDAGWVHCTATMGRGQERVPFSQNALVLLILPFPTCSYRSTAEGPRQGSAAHLVGPRLVAAHAVVGVGVDGVEVEHHHQVAWGERWEGGRAQGGRVSGMHGAFECYVSGKRGIQRPGGRHVLAAKPAACMRWGKQGGVGGCRLGCCARWSAAPSPSPAPPPVPRNPPCPIPLRRLSPPLPTMQHPHRRGRRQREDKKGNKESNPASTPP